MNRVLPLVGLILLLGCQEELSIAEFEDEFREYESELRIEAILDPVNPWNSIVRVDRTILITDITIFDGVDNDSDWVAFEDQNENGQWDEGEPLNDDVGEDGVIGGSGGFGPEKDEGEGNGRPDQGEPHVDEYDEILPQIHVSTATVTLVELITGDPVIDFVWDPQADSFRVAAGPQGAGLLGVPEEWETVTYGGYRPLAINDSISYDKQYEFQIVTDDQRITGPVDPLRPPTFINSLESPLNVDTLVVTAGSGESLRWRTEEDATVVWVAMEEVGPDSLELLMSHPSEAIDQLDDGRWIGEHVLGVFFPGLYRWTITVPDRAYGAYFYSNLPMRDEQLSNLRDENDDDRVVLGIAGSMAASVQYVRIIE